MIVYPIMPPLPAPPYGNQLKDLYEGDDARAQAFVDGLVGFVPDADGADALMAALVLCVIYSEAIRRLQDDSRHIIKQDAFDALYTGVFDTIEATNDATITPAVWTT